MIPELFTIYDTFTEKPSRICSGVGQSYLAMTALSQDLLKLTIHIINCYIASTINERN